MQLLDSVQCWTSECSELANAVLINAYAGVVRRRQGPGYVIASSSH